MYDNVDQIVITKKNVQGIVIKNVEAEMVQLAQFSKNLEKFLISKRPESDYNIKKVSSTDL